MITIPTKIIVTGNIDAGKKLIGLGKAQVALLEGQMRYQSLKQGSRTVQPFPGTGIVIECWSCFGLRQVSIHVPVSEGEEKKQERRYCDIFPCFAFGVIEKDTSNLSDAQIKDGYRHNYDVSLCTEYAYILLENMHVQPSGWGKYHVGQYVLITIDALEFGGSIPNCCINDACLPCDLDDSTKLTKSHLHIIPVSILEGMAEWRITTS